MIRRILLFVSFLGQPSPLNYSRKLSHLGKQLGSAVFSLIWKTAGNTFNKEDIWEFRYEKQLERTFWFLRENNKHLHDSDRSSRNLRECFGLVCESERVWWERDNWCRCSGILNLLTHLGTSHQQAFTWAREHACSLPPCLGWIPLTAPLILGTTAPNLMSNHFREVLRLLGITAFESHEQPSQSTNTREWLERNPYIYIYIYISHIRRSLWWETQT